ncbi:hypothetical protein LCGC14_2015920 [marine sediment metagenome]|uniref:Uncharacterized protein n=1 Tax=marine sediment metagenome TaxID=412755 RepID=A0A0F9HW57_9ZZZZ
MAQCKSHRETGIAPTWLHYVTCDECLKVQEYRHHSLGSQRAAQTRQALKSPEFKWDAHEKMLAHEMSWARIRGLPSPEEVVASSNRVRITLGLDSR